MKVRPLRKDAQFVDWSPPPFRPEVEALFADYVPSPDELERMRKAEEKRMRKRMKNLDKMADTLFGKDENNQSK